MVDVDALQKNLFQGGDLELEEYIPDSIHARTSHKHELDFRPKSL